MSKPSGSALISIERERQVKKEGWTPEHDDRHDMGELVDAARGYAMAALYIESGLGFEMLPERWPWEAEWWKPSDDPIRNLVKAGALIAAEIDRLQRAAT